MSLTLARKDAEHFKTHALQVEASCDQLNYWGCGAPLNFAQMQAKRQPLTLADERSFSVELANLGVSVRLTLELAGREYWLVVRQQRADRGDTVLKLISGYVPSHQLNLPLLTALYEVSEECLVECSHGFLSGRYQDTQLPQPYAQTLQSCADCHFALLPYRSACQEVLRDSLPLLERPHAYVHLPTSSLQLIYDLRLELPCASGAVSLFHAEDCLESGQLVTRLNRQQPDLFLIEQCHGRPSGALWQLREGQLQAVDAGDCYLSEAFCAQQGWLIEQERIAWDQWLGQYH